MLQAWLGEELQGEPLLSTSRFSEVGVVVVFLFFANDDKL